MRQPPPNAALRSFCAIVVVAALAGCWRTASKPPPPAPVIVAQQPKVVEQPPPEQIPEPPPVEVAPPAEVITAEPPPPPIPTEKFLLCSPRGPLVVEFEIWIDGQPQMQVFDQLLDEVLQLADTDGDGRPTWKEVTTSPKFRYGQFGNLPFDRENAPKQIIQQYDLNGNGLVDRTELPRFLTRNAGGARAFSIRSLEQFHGRNRRGSPTWQAIDADDDGELTAAELQQAFAQLKLHDADDDEILLVDELRPTADVDPNNGMRTRGQLGDFARLLGEHANWDSIRTALEQQYALGGNLGPDDFLLMSEVFQQLDTDKDGKLLKKEFPELNNIAPHLRFRIDFGLTAKEAEQPPKPTTVQLISSRLTADQTGGAPPQVLELPGRVILRWPGVALTFVRNDTIAAVDYEMQAQQGLTMYDADTNGYLEAREVNETVQAQFARFEALDSDNDGKVYPGEIAVFLRQRQGAQRAQVHTRAQDQEDALFLALDGNNDDRLDAQELETAATRLSKLDANADGKITGDELPAGLAIVTARGSIENANQLFATGPVEQQAPVGILPAWFTAMDTSRDGVISAREFLGTAEKFAALDKNQNGFFEPQEIPAEQIKQPANDATPAEAPAERNDP
jgi:Ca2+-binding EF-hand superfamily protein